jgi:hypothetical protein
LKDYWLLKINKSSAQGKKEKQKWKPDFDFLVFSSWEGEDIFFLGGKRYNTIPFFFYYHLLSGRIRVAVFYLLSFCVLEHGALLSLSAFDVGDVSLNEIVFRQGFME